MLKTTDKTASHRFAPSLLSGPQTKLIQLLTVRGQKIIVILQQHRTDLPKPRVNANMITVVAAARALS